MLILWPEKPSSRAGRLSDILDDAHKAISWNEADHGAGLPLGLANLEANRTACKAHNHGCIWVRAPLAIRQLAKVKDWQTGAVPLFYQHLIRGIKAPLLPGMQHGLTGVSCLPRGLTPRNVFSSHLQLEKAHGTSSAAVPVSQSRLGFSVGQVCGKSCLHCLFGFGTA